MLLAIELLVFEFQSRSLIPIIFASVVAAAMRGLFRGGAPIFGMPAILGRPNITHLAVYTALGVIVGAASVLVTRAVYAIEDGFALLPLLAGCTGAYYVSSILMRDTIMTEKIARRGIMAPSDYAPDILSQMLVRDAATYDVASLGAGATLAEVRSWIGQGRPESDHHDFPVVDGSGQLLGMAAWRDLVNPNRPETQTAGELVHKLSTALLERNTLREAVDLMVREGARRLPVVAQENRRKLVAILSHSDIMAAHRRRLQEASEAQQGIHWHLGALWRSRQRRD